VNKLRFDRFSDAVDDCFDTIPSCRGEHGSIADQAGKILSHSGSSAAHSNNPKASEAAFNTMKEEVYENLRQWYRSTHSISAVANAQDMTAILEAYWNLSAKRFVDQSCMLADKLILGKLASFMQEYMYKFVRNEAKLEVKWTLCCFYSTHTCIWSIFCPYDQLFFTEDPAIGQQRDDAERRRDRLIGASSALAAIPVHYFAASSAINRIDNIDVETDDTATTASDEAVATKDLWATVAPVDLVVGRDGRQYKRVGLTVNITGSGIGVIVSDSSTGQLVVSGFREMPNGMPNPSLEAGMQVGDILEQINGKIPATPQEAGMLLKASKGATPFAVLRAV
jgi:hypothetical protein